MARTMLDLASQAQGSLPNSQVALDSTHRFVTDAEKSGWDAKAGADVVTTEANGLMSSAMLTKLNGIEANANNYSHPSSHALSMITETASLKIMTGEERSKLSGIEASADVTDATNVEASGAVMLDRVEDQLTGILNTLITDEELQCRRFAINFY